MIDDQLGRIIHSVIAVREKVTVNPSTDPLKALAGG